MTVYVTAGHRFRLAPDDGWGSRYDGEYDHTLWVIWRASGASAQTEVRKVGWDAGGFGVPEIQTA